MALTTHVTDRFGSASSFLLGLTNHDDEDATSINSTRLSKAAEAAEGQFPVHAQVAYDDTDAAHIEAGVWGVIAYLRAWSTKQGAATPELQQFQQMLRDIAKTSSRKRITPVRADPVDFDDEDLFAGLSPEFDDKAETD